MAAEVTEPDSASAPPARVARRKALREQAPLLWCVVLLGAGAGLCVLDTPLWWLGGASLSAGLALALRAYPEPRAALIARLNAPHTLLGRQVTPLPWLLDALCIAVVLAVALVMMADLLDGSRPVSRDHTVHYAKAYFLRYELLPEGRIYGWSREWFAGFPANYLYPPGADLWVCLVHLLSFGALSFGQAYSAAFVLFHALTGLSTYVFGRVIAGRLVSVIAAVLCVSDPGAFRMGGFKYTVEYGVWPQALSLSFSLLAFSCLPGIVQTRRLAPVGAFGLWMGLAFITHPIQLLFALLALLVAAICSVVVSGVHAATACMRLLAAAALSGWVGTLWLVPFFSARAETNQMGVWWDTTYEMAKGLLNAQLFPGTLGYVFAFGLIGIALMLRTRAFMPWFVGLTAITVPALTNSTVIDELHAANLIGSLAKIQYLRLSTMVKPFWFVLAAYAVITALRNARVLIAREDSAPEAGDKRSLLRTTVLAGLLALLTLPVLVPLCEVFLSSHVLRMVMTETDRPDHEDRKKLEAFLKRELPQDGYYRVGVFTGDQHDMLDIGTIIDRPLYKRGFTPASNYIYQPRERFPSILEAVNLRFALSKYPLPVPTFEEIASFGIWTVYRYNDYAKEPFKILQGSGEVALERFDREEIVLRAGKGASGQLRLNVSYFSRWKAYRDGERVPITVTFLRDSPDDTGFITVPLAPGTYRFAFERTLGDRLAIPLGLLGMGACLGLVFVDRRRRAQQPAVSAKRLSAWVSKIADALDRLSERRFLTLRRALLALALAGGVAGFVALATWKPAIDIAELPGLGIERVRFDFIERLSQARAGIRYREAYRPCMRQGDRLVCRNAEGELDIDNYVGNSPATLKDYILVRCMRARPVHNGTLHIRYPSVPVGDAIIGYYGVEREGRLMTKRRPVHFQMTIGDNEVYAGSTNSDNKIHSFRVSMPKRGTGRTSVGFSVRADNVSRRYFCFHAQVVDLR